MTHTAQSRPDEVAEKVERIRALLTRRGLDGALFTNQFLFGWITAGMEDVILRGAHPGFAWALVTRDGLHILGSAVEATRIEREELPGELGFSVAGRPWYEGHHAALVEELCETGKLINDGAGPGADGSAELQELRLHLTAGERDRMRVLGADSCAAVEASMLALRAGMTEAELCADICAGLERRRIFPSAVLIGSDERRGFRHPTVSSKVIQRDAMVVIVAVRGGLNVAFSRTSSIDTPDDEVARRHLIACEAEARAIEASRPGTTYETTLQALVDTYARHGLPEEWREHTQGGPIGYAGREFVPAPPAVADANSRRAIELHNAIAYNPTVQGGKSEDTFLVGETSNDVVTVSESWPTVTVPLADGEATRPAIAEVG